MKFPIANFALIAVASVAICFAVPALDPVLGLRSNKPAVLANVPYYNVPPPGIFSGNIY